MKIAPQNPHSTMVLTDRSVLLQERDKLRARIKELEACEFAWEQQRRKVEQLRAENERLKKILAREMSENDEIGSEFVYVGILKTENIRLRAVLEQTFHHLIIITGDHQSPPLIQQYAGACAEKLRAALDEGKG